jgi:S1-C subfamily serine protease
VKSDDELILSLEKYSVGDQVTVTVRRDDSTLDLQVRLQQL